MRFHSGHCSRWNCRWTWICGSYDAWRRGSTDGNPFCCCKRIHGSENYKQRVVKAKDIDSEVTGMSTGHPIRVIRNKMTREYLKKEKEGAPFEELEQMTLGALRKAVVEGDVMYGSVMAGQSAGLVKKEETCAEIIRDVMSGAEKLLGQK